MKKLFAVLLLAVPLWAGSNTTRMGMYKPDDHETGWGTFLRNNYDIVDSSAAILSANQTFTGANIFQSATTLAATTVSSATNPQLAINNTNFAGPFLAGLTFGFNSSAFSYLGESNSNQLCSDFTTICSVDALQFGPTSGSPHFAIDVNGKIAIGTSSFSKSTATVSGNMLIGSGYATVTNAPTDGLRVKGGVTLDSTLTVASTATLSNLTASQFVKTDASKNLVSYDLIGGTQTLTGTNTFNNNNNTFTGTMTFPGAGAASFKNSSNNATSQIFNNGTSGQDTMEFTASKGFAFGPSSTISGSNFAIVSPAGNTYEMTVGTSTTSGVQDFAVTQTGITQPTIFQVPSKTKAQLNALAPSTAGLIYYCSDCSTDGVVVSTGTGTGAFGRISARTTAIN